MSNFMNAMNKYRRARWGYTHGLKPMAKAYEMLIYLVRNGFIPASCELGGYYLRLQGNRPRHTQTGEGGPQLHNWATGDYRRVQWALRGSRYRRQPRDMHGSEGSRPYQNWQQRDHRCQRGHDFGRTGQYSLGRCAG